MKYLSFLIFAIFLYIYSASPAYAQSAENNIKIGIAAPFTGSYSFLGPEMLQGAEAAVEAINSRGGLLGKSVELVVRDDACDINQANRVAREFIYEAKVKAVVGHCPDFAMEIDKVYQESETLFLIPFSSDVEPRDQIYYYGSIFELAPRAERLGEMVADEIINASLGFSFGVITDETYFSQQMASTFENSLYSRGPVLKASISDLNEIKQLLSRVDVVLFTTNFQKTRKIIESLEKSYKQAELVIIGTPMVDARSWTDLIDATNKRGLNVYVVSPSLPRRPLFTKTLGEEAIYLLFKRNIQIRLTHYYVITAFELLAQSIEEADTENTVDILRAFRGSHKQTLLGALRSGEQGEVKFKSKQNLSREPVNRSNLTKKALLPIQSDKRTGKSDHILWNLWAEESRVATDRPSFAPVSYLRPDQYYLFTLDLSGVSYQKKGGLVLTQRLGGDFEKDLKWWRDKGLPNPTLKVVIIGDSLYFEKPDRFVGDLKIDFDNMRIHKNRGFDVSRDPFDILREKEDKDPDFVFGRVVFRIKTKQNLPEGFAHISLSLWNDGKPLDEISARICVTSDKNAKNCNGIEASQFGLKGVDSLYVGSDSKQLPEAALHFLQVNSNVTGIFRRNDWPENKYIYWPLRYNISALKSKLSNWLDAYVATRDDETQLGNRGTGLYNILFPPTQLAARKQFEEFIKPYLKDDSKRVDQRAPSIFVRMIQEKADPPLLIPLGLLAVKLDQKPAEFLGFHFRIESPLEIQSYKSSDDCISRWVTVIPPPNHPDKALRRAALRLTDRIKLWRKQAWKPFEDMREFGKWVSESQTEKTSTAIVILSHHTDDRITFEPEKLVHSSEVTRRFSRPSIVVLSGCGTAKPGSVGFLREFNRNGINTVIATSTEVDPEMAGDFLNTFSKVLEDNKNDAQFNVAVAYFKAIQVLQDKTPPQGNIPYGARVLEFTFLGNGNTRLCPPEK
jgi:branched-chain amino acid transport system substrate-binding protein